MFIAASTILYLISITILIISIIFIILNNIIIIEWELLSIMSITIKINIILEWRNTIYSAIIILISANVIKFSKTYIAYDSNKSRFTYIVLIFIISINLLIFIPNMTCLLIGWDGLGATSFILIIYYNNQRSLSAGIFTILVNRLGDAFILISIIRTINIGDWTTINIQKYNILQLLGIIIAAITKRAQIPYSRWLPAAIAAPTPVSALVHSSTLVTAGIFLLYRFNNIIKSSPTIQKSLTITGILTILIARITAIYENDIKKIIALSTLRQLGLITMCLGISIPRLAFIHISIHALFKALLFIRAGCLISLNNHNQDLRIYGKYSNLSPVVSSSIIISNIALIGTPFISGYYSKHTIINWSNNQSINMTIYILILSAIIITSYYSTRLVIFILGGPSLIQILHAHNSSKNYELSIINISIIRIIMGRTLQWLMPVIKLSPPINENFKSSLLPTCLITIRLLIALNILIPKNLTHKNTANSKFILSLMFIRPIWTKFSITLWINLSLYLYKHLDQSWMEKIIRLGPSKLLRNSRVQLNSLINMPLQQKRLQYIRIRAIFIYLAHTLFK